MKRKYRVLFDLSGGLSTEVWADSRDQASEIAGQLDYGSLTEEETDWHETDVIELQHYTLVIGNVGTVYDSWDTDNIQALLEYDTYASASLNGFGRCSGEDVTLFVDGEPEKEFTIFGKQETQP
jgi:hypothetical protein